MSTPSFSTRAAAVSGPAATFKPVTPSDAADLPDGVTRGLYVAGAGALTVRDAEGNEITLVSGPGQYHPLRIARVLATGATATGVVALY